MTKSDQFYSGKNKLEAYDQESRYLMLDAMDFEDVHTEKFTLPEIVYLLRNTFKERSTRYKVLGKEDLELYDQEYKIDSEGNKIPKDPSSGFCMVSSYLIYSMTGGDKVWELHGTTLHWWLYHKQSQTRFDITHTQFDPKELNHHYSLGKNVKYLNTDPMFFNILREKAKILAHSAGLE